MKYHVLYNPKAGNGTGETETKNIEKFLSGEEVVYYDVTLNDTAELISKIPLGDKIAISGGDGTLNRFVNDTKDIKLITKFIISQREAVTILSTISAETNTASNRERLSRKEKTQSKSADFRLFIFKKSALHRENLRFLLNFIKYLPKPLDKFFDIV